MPIAEDGSIDVSAGFSIDLVPVVAPSQMGNLTAAVSSSTEPAQWVTDITTTVNDTETFQNKLTLTATAATGGTYELAISYSWSHDAQTTDFISRAQQDGTNLTGRSTGELHVQEPKDSAGTNIDGTGTDQSHGFHRSFIIVLPADAAPVFTLDYRSGDAGTEASIGDASMILRRLGD